MQRHAVTILCYHDLPADVADKHLAILRTRYTLISLRQFLDWRLGRTAEPLPPYSLVVTLDDGHRGNASLIPMLTRAPTPLTVFLCSAIVGTHRHFWWTKVNDIREREWLKRLPDSKRRSWLARHGHNDMKEYSDRQALSRDEIDMLKPLLDFQSHTRFHPILPQCSMTLARDEIAGSKTELRRRLGICVFALAYPNGDYSEREIQLARAAGYECALSLDAGYNWANTHIFRLRRIPVDDHAGVNELLVKVSGLWSYLGKIWRRPRFEWDTFSS